MDTDEYDDEEEGETVPAADAEAWRGRSRQRRLQTSNDLGEGTTTLHSAMAGEREAFMTTNETHNVNVDVKENTTLMNSMMEDTGSGNELPLNTISTQTKSTSTNIQVSTSRTILDDAVEDPKGASAFIGLIVHAAVDGVALGAAVAEGDASLGAIVFLAIMLHKAPSSFGLATYLLHHGSSIAQVCIYMYI